MKNQRERKSFCFFPEITHDVHPLMTTSGMKMSEQKRVLKKKTGITALALNASFLKAS